MDIRKNFLCGIGVLFLFSQLMADPIVIPTGCEDISCTMELFTTPESVVKCLPWEKLYLDAATITKAKAFVIVNFVVAKINVSNTSKRDDVSVSLKGLEVCVNRFADEVEYSDLPDEEVSLLGLALAFENRLVPVFNIEFNCFESVAGKICDPGQNLNGFLFIPRKKLGAVTERVTEGKASLSCENLERVSPLHNVESLLPLFSDD